MQDQTPPRKSALRDVWKGVLVAAALMWAGSHPEEFGRGDMVSASFLWFFSTFGLYPGLAMLAGLSYVVARRVERGDPFKEDLSLMLSALGMCLTLAGMFFPQHVKEASDWLLSVLKPLSQP